MPTNPTYSFTAEDAVEHVKGTNPKTGNAFDFHVQSCVITHGRFVVPSSVMIDVAGGQRGYAPGDYEFDLDKNVIIGKRGLELARSMVLTRKVGSMSAPKAA